MLEENITFDKEISERLVSTLWDRKIARRILTVRRKRRKNKILLTVAGIMLSIGIAIFQLGINEDVATTITASIGGTDASLPITEYLGSSSGLVLDDEMNQDSIDTILNE